MTDPRSERVQFLRKRNSQNVFLRRLREAGVPEPEALFAFVDDSEYEAARNAVRERGLLRWSLPSERCERPVAVEAAKRWLERNPGEVLCLLSEAGGLTGGGGEFLRCFAQFEEVWDRQSIFFVRRDLSAGFCLSVEEYAPYFTLSWGAAAAGG